MHKLYMNEQNYPEIVVGALIFDQESKVFLMASARWLGKYTVVGGHIKTGETSEEALRREVKEETNLDIFDIQFLMAQDCIFSEEFYQKKHFVFLEYICKTKDTDVILEEKEGTGYVWATIDEALKLPLNLHTRNMILEYKKKIWR